MTMDWGVVKWPSAGAQSLSVGILWVLTGLLDCVSCPLPHPFSQFQPGGTAGTPTTTLPSSHSAPPHSFRSSQPQFLVKALNRTNPKMELTQYVYDRGIQRMPHPKETKNM